MSKKPKSKVASFLLVLQFLFSFVLPLQPLVGLVQAQENQTVTFSKNESSISVANSQASKFSYFFKASDSNTIFGSFSEATSGADFKLNLTSPSGSDSADFNVDRLVLKTNLNSYFLEIAEKQVKVLKEYQSDSLDKTSEEENFLMNSWQTDSVTRMSTTSSDVVLNQEYRFPLNEEVRVTFTKLPSESSPLSIQEVQLSAAQQKALGTTASVAYDVTTAMKDGEFAFDLRLPSVSSENKDVSVKFAESISELSTAKTAENELTVNDEGDVTVKNLDHMTIFVVIYNSKPSVMPGSFPSQGFAATSTSEFGDHLILGGTERNVGKVSVGLTNWACENDFVKVDGVWVKSRGNSDACVTTPGSSYIHPITLNIYNVDHSTSVPKVGTIVTSKTVDASIPFRPSYDSSCKSPTDDTPFGGMWKDSSGNCFHGYASDVNFDLSGVTLPSEVIVAVAYNTSSHGYSPLGVAGPYDSLNVSLASTAPSFGTNANLGDVFMNTSYAGFYTDGGAAGVGILRQDTGWEGYVPVIKIEAIEADLVAPVVHIDNPTSSLVNGIIDVMGTITDDNPHHYWLVIQNNLGQTVAGPETVNQSSSLDNASLYSWNTNNFAEGNYTIKLEARDAFNNKDAGSVHWLPVTIDRTPPAKAVLSSPAHNAWVSGNPTQSWNAVPTTDHYVYESSLVSDFSSVAFSTTVNATNRTVGGNQTIGFWWRVKAVDAAGNEGPWSDAWFLNVDNTLPAMPTGLTRFTPNGLTELQCGDFSKRQTLIPTWNDLASSDPSFDHYEYSSFNPNGSVGIDKQSLFTAKFVHTWVPTSDGAHGYSVRSVDKAGNKSAWALSGENLAGSCQITYDSVNPSTPTINGFKNPNLSCGAITNQRTVTVDWSDSTDNFALAGYDYNIDYPNGTTRGVWDAYFTNSEYRGTLNEGTHYVKVRAKDKAGNVSTWSNTCEITYDSIAPLAPILSSPANNAHVKGAVLTNDWQNVDGAVKYIYESYHNSAATLLRFRGEYTDSQKTATNVADTEFWWRVRAVDAAGNEGPWSDLWHVVVDSTSPFLVSKSTFTGWLNADQLSTFTFDDVGSEIVSGLPVSCTISTEGAAQTCTVTPNVCDEAGNCYTSQLTSNSANIDKTKPTSTISVPTDSSLITNNWDGVISGAAADAASGVDRVELEITHSLSGSTLATASGSLDGFGQYNWTYTLPNEPEEGTYTITSHAVDKVGNRENSYTITIIYDKTIPKVDIAVNPDPADGKNGWYNTQPTVTLTMTEVDPNLDRIEYQWDSKDAGGWTSSSSPASFQLMNEGRHILYYRAIDKAGNGDEEENTGIKNLAWDKTELTEGPLKVDATPDRSGGPEAKVTWEAATDNVGIDHYKVTFDLLNGDADFSEDVASHVRELKTNRLKESGTWKITVIAYDGAGHEKSASDEIVVDKTAPTAPTLNLTGTGAGSVDLAWNKVDDANEYIILYGVNDGQYTYAARVGNVLNYKVQGLTAGSYYFVVRAEDGSGNQSANSNQVSTPSLLAAPGGGNEVAQGFEQAPEVLGVNTAEQPKSESQAASNGEVQGANTSCNDLVNSLWWILLLAQFIGLFITEYKLGKKQKWLKLGLYALLAVAPYTFTHYFVSQSCLSNVFTSWMVRYYFVPVLATAMLAKVASYLLIEDES